MAYLLERVESEEQRAWALFCWVSQHVSCDTSALLRAVPKAPPKDDEVLRKRLAVGQGYAELFQSLCQAAGLQVRRVAGCTLCWGRGDSGCNHTWNAVCIDGEWLLVDCLLGAGDITQPSSSGRNTPTFAPCFRPQYFGPAPEEFAFTHLPSEDSAWQLLEPEVSQEAFLAQASVNADVFFGLGLRFWPEYRPGKQLALTTSNAGSMQMKVPNDVVLMATLNGEPARCFQQRLEEAGTTRLKVTIRSAARMRNMDHMGKSDPYCICRLAGKPQTGFRTRAIPDSSNPTWNETKEISGVTAGDRLEFIVNDKDFGTRDDLLGSCDLATDNFLAGGSFDGDLELDNDGVAGSTLRVAVESLGREPRQITAEETGVTTVYFRAPPGSQESRLEISARRLGPRGGSYCHACAFTVLPAPAALTARKAAHHEEELFPEVDWDAFSRHKVAFPEALPKGRFVLAKRNEVECRLLAPPGVEASAAVDGNKSAAMVQRDGSSLVIWAACPPGEHKLRVGLRQGELGEYAHAVTWRLSVPADCKLGAGGLPMALGLFHELGAFLEAPMQLWPGQVSFRLRLDARRVERVAVVAGGGQAQQFLEAKGDGLFQGDIQIPGFEAEILCAPPLGELKPLVRWALKTPAPD